MKTYEPTNLEIAEIFLRVLCDKVPEKVDAFFIHGDIGNEKIQESLIAEAVRYFKEGRSEYIVINGLTSEDCIAKDHAYCGYEKYTESLLNKGIPEDKILHIIPSDNTAEESENILKKAKEKNWNTLIIESMPYHQPRCLLSIVAAMKKLGIHLKVYNTTFHDVDWDMQVQRKVWTGQNVLGQKDKKGPFIDLMKNELERIQKYTIPSEDYIPHATIAEALEYLKMRDAVV